MKNPFSNPWIWVGMASLLFVAFAWITACAPLMDSFYMSEIPTKKYGDIKIALPEGVKDFTKQAFFGARINEELCIVTFPEEVDFHKLIVACNGEPTIYALIRFEASRFDFWIYIGGFPIPASREKIEGLIKQYGKAIPSSYKGVV